MQALLKIFVQSLAYEVLPALQLIYTEKCFTFNINHQSRDNYLQKSRKKKEKDLFIVFLIFRTFPGVQLFLVMKVEFA